jgi:hypothetical protein
MRRRNLFFVLMGFFAAGSAGAAEPSVPMAAHHAEYDLTSEQIRGTQIAGASGTMSYEVIDACDGWASHQRLRIIIDRREGQDVEMVSDYTTWESKDGKSMRFRMRQTTDGAVTTNLAGDAALDKPDGAGEVHYVLPEKAVKALPPGTLFPTRHTEAILRAAREGRKFMTLPLFDGTDEAGAQDSSVLVFAWDKGRDQKWPALQGLPSARVHVAFFNRQDVDSEPDYEVSMRYWENGIADDLDMDFGDFVMKAKLTKLALLPSKC